MNGLKYIRGLFNISLRHLALEIGVSNQLISMWERGIKKIPDKRTEQLSRFFKLPEHYFNLIVDEVEKAEILALRLKNHVDEYEEQANFIPNYLIEEMAAYDVLIEKEKFIKQLDDLLNYSFTDFENIRLLQRFAIILEKEDLNIIRDIFTALEMSEQNQSQDLSNDFSGAICTLIQQRKHEQQMLLKILEIDEGEK